jgi:carbon-monoxide dehydrogenase large subunit
VGVSVSVLGHAVSRREDPALLRGEARFVADLAAEGGLHAHFVRSTAAHALLLEVDATEAVGTPGLVGVWTADDLDLPGLGELPPPPDGQRDHLRRPCLTTDRVRFVGEAVAVVVAETAAAAVDAAELVTVELSDLPAVVDPLAALELGVPVLFPEHGCNLVVDLPGTDPGALEGADVVVRERFVNQRVAPAPLEPGAALAVPRDDNLELWVSTQAPFAVRGAVCAALGLPPGSVRVVAPAVGGGFGAKGGAYPEHVVVAALARRLGRPVRWVETRSENLVAMIHGRGQVQDVELGARADGTIVGLRLRTVTNVGAYAWGGGIAVTTSRTMASGPSRIPRVDAHAQGVVTTTTPAGPYRGAGRPEAAALLERAVDLLAAELGADPVELRQRNLLRPDELPYDTPTGGPTTAATTPPPSTKPCAWSATTSCVPSSAGGGSGMTRWRWASVSPASAR